jgi:Protein of unknown function DUF262/Protein of unknown function (DUF1524)
VIPWLRYTTNQVIKGEIRMASALLETNTLDFKSLLGNGSMFRVPRFQRDYAWTRDNWEDLWSDITDLEQQVGPVQHYMGALVTQQKGDEVLIIDGQQRVTTLSILALAVLDALKALGETERFNLLFASYIGGTDPGSLKPYSKLALNANDDGFYQAHLVGLKPPINRRKLTESQKKLWDAFEFFCEKIRSNPTLKTGQALSAFLNDFLAKRLMFILIRVQDEVSAYTVFETLNARGVELTSGDLLKNYLYAQVSRSPIDLAHAQDQWQSICEIVSASEVPDFLRIYLNSNQAPVRPERLFRAIRTLAQTPEQVFNLLDKLERAAIIYAALGDENDDYWKDFPKKCQQHVRALKLFQAEAYKPLALACAEQLDGNELERVLGATVAVMFRYVVIGRRRTNELERVFNLAARQVSSRELRSAHKVEQILTELYLTDAEFVESFVSAQRPYAGPQKKLIPYILCQIEAKLTGKPLDFETLDCSIEHVLPANPSPEWAKQFSQTDLFVSRLGNYALMDIDDNRLVGNTSYTNKLPKYKISKYETTREISYQEWNPAALEDRQRKLAEHAVGIWRIQSLDSK